MLWSRTTINLWGNDDEKKADSLVSLSVNYPSIRVPMSFKQDLSHKLEDIEQTNSEIFRYAIKMLVPDSNSWLETIIEPNGIYFLNNYSKIFS